MSLGRARRRDATERAIVEALRAAGVDVLFINGVGVPDLLVHRAGKWLPIEVKSPGGKLTPQQIAVRSRMPFPVVSSVAEALALFGVKTVTSVSNFAAAEE